MVQHCEPPNTEWDLFDIDILGSYDNFEKANKKATKAQHTNNLASSQSESEQSKRKSKANPKYANEYAYNSSSDSNNLDRETSPDSDSSLHVPQLHTASLPPKVQKKGLQFRETATLSPIYTPRTISNEGKSYKPSCVSLQKSTDYDGCAFDVNQKKGRSVVDLSCTSLDRMQDKISLSRDRESLQGSPSSGRRATNKKKEDSSMVDISHEGFTGSDKRFQKLVINELFSIKNMLSSLTEKVEQLTIAGGNQTKSVEEVDALRNIMGLIPISFDKDLQTIEKALSSEETMQLFATELSLIGGNEAKTMTKKIMYRLFSNEIGQNFSFEGAKGKEVFKNLFIYKAIVRAIRLNKKTSNSTEAEIIPKIKDWLAKAKERHTNQKRRIQSKKS
ncbi:hypothetical protein PPYR_01067 [Photinus pyralis]|nr:hypothetical protein PPYR_01067 [Photinus pyralis]